MAKMMKMAKSLQQTGFNFNSINADMVKQAQDDIPVRKTPFANMTRLSEVPHINPYPDIIPGYIKGGKPYAIVGTPGSGKTTYWMDLTTHISRGLPYHGKPVMQGSVVIVCTELDAVDIVDRLDAMGANLDNIWLIKAVQVNGNGQTSNGQQAEYDFMLPESMNILQEQIDELANSDDPTVLACHLVVFDTFLTFLTDACARSKEKCTLLMNTLKDMCSETGMSMLLLAHFKATWSTNSNPDFYKVVDLPVPFLRIIQHAYMVQRDIQTGDFNLMPMKHNASNEPLALTFRLFTNQQNKTRVIYPQYVNEEKDSSEILKHKILMFLYAKHCSSGIAVGTAFKSYTRPVIAVAIDTLVKDGHIKNSGLGCIDLTAKTRQEIEDIVTSVPALSMQQTMILP